VAEPGDVVEAVGVGERHAERARDVEAVRPVLGEARRGQRGRLQRAADPLHEQSRVGRPQRGERRRTRSPPPLEHGLRLVTLGHDHPLGGVVDASRRARPRPRPDRRGDGGRSCLLRLREVEHDVGDRPALGQRRRREPFVVERRQDGIEALVLGGEVVDDHPPAMAPIT
jgi:hypothetical protein